MDKKLRETTNLGVEVMNSKWQAKRKLSHVVMFNLSNISLKSPAPGMRSMPMIHRLKILLPNSNLILKNINMYDVKTNSFLTWYEIWLTSRTRNWKRSNSHVDETTGSGQIQCLSVIRKQQSKMIIARKRLKRNVPLIIVQIKPYFSHKHSSAPEGSEGK